MTFRTTVWGSVSLRSGAVTENGVVYAWGRGGSSGGLGNKRHMYISTCVYCCLYPLVRRALNMGYSTWASYLVWFDWVTEMLISRHAMERVRALHLLGETDPELLAMHSQGVAFKLMDGDGRVRLAALETLEKLLATMISRHALIPLRRVQNTDSDPRVRIAATDTLRKIGQAILNPQHGSRIIPYTLPAMNLPTT